LFPLQISFKNVSAVVTTQNIASSPGVRLPFILHLLFQIKHTCDITGFWSLS